MAALLSPMATSRTPRSRRTLLVLRVLVALVASFSAPGLAARRPIHEFVNVVTIAGPCCTDQGNDLAVDTEGSILVAGRRGSLDLDRDETIDVKAWGSPDPLVSKATLTGKINTGWTLGLGGPKDEFEECLHIGKETLQSKGLHDGFLVRYDRAGAPLWSRAISGAGRDVLTGVKTDGDGNAIFVGIVKGAVDVDRNGTIDVTGNADGTAGIASFGPAGRFQSAPSMRASMPKAR